MSDRFNSDARTLNFTFRQTCWKILYATKSVQSNLKNIIWFTASLQFAYRKLTSEVCIKERRDKQCLTDLIRMPARSTLPLGKLAGRFYMQQRL